MSSNMSEQDRPSGGDSCSIMTGTFNREAWVKEFMDYLNTMRESSPDHNHPSLEWVRLGFSQISLDPDQSAVASLPPDINIAVRSAVANIVDGPIADLRKKLDKHTKHHSVNEVNSRQITLNQQKKRQAVSCKHVCQ